MAWPCIFCGDPANSHEHVIPKWVAKRCGLHGVFLGLTEAHGDATRPTPSRQIISFKSHRHRVFCKACNEHFKLTLEDKVCDLVQPMCLGQARTFSPSECDLLATWAVKTGYALISVEPGLAKSIPEWQRFHLRERGRPPDGVFAAFGRYQGLAQKDVTTSSTAEPDPAVDRSVSPGGHRHFYNASLAFGHVFFKIFGTAEPSDSDAWEYPGDLMTHVWPSRSLLLEWPTQTLVVRQPESKAVFRRNCVSGYGDA